MPCDLCKLKSVTRFMVKREGKWYCDDKCYQKALHKFS